jgi:uncharacterized protein YqhQ
MLKEIRRVFEYHGAEHKSIHAYEKGEELTVENAKKYPTLHARCGTAFLLLVLVFSILMFTLVFPLFPKDIFVNKVVTNIFFILVKIVLMLPIAGISYEMIRYADRANNRFLNLMLLPGMWMQKLTTREPSDDQIEVALIALKKTLEKEEMRNGVQSAA